jgi:hypothetical protein
MPHVAVLEKSFCTWSLLLGKNSHSEICVWKCSTMVYQEARTFLPYFSQLNHELLSVSLYSQSIIKRAISQERVPEDEIGWPAIWTKQYACKHNHRALQIEDISWKLYYMSTFANITDHDKTNQQLNHSALSDCTPGLTHNYMSHWIMLWPKRPWTKFQASCETQSAKLFLYIPDMDMWERQQTALMMPPKLQNLGMSAS